MSARGDSLSGQRRAGGATTACEGHSGASRRGFSLVELVLATTVLAVGVLAVASTTLPVARLVRWGDAQAAAAAAAAGRIETLRTLGCASAGDGETAVLGRYRLRWTVAASGPLRPVQAVVTYPWAGASRSDTFETAIACP